MSLISSESNTLPAANDIPNILIISSDEEYGKSIIKGITNTTLENYENCSFQWTIDNKYYTADVEFYNAFSPESLNSSLIESSEAILIHLSSLQLSNIDELNKMLDNLKNPNYEVMLLACDDFTVEIPKLKVQEWCIEYGWELVEFNPETKSNCSEEDDFADSFGYQRISQALNANTWSNLQMKSGNDGSSNGIGQILQALTLNTEEAPENSSLSYMKLEDNLQENEDIEDDFSNLLTSLNEMKEKASELPSVERKLYAEKMAIAFWKSIGGNEDEIQGLDSDDSE